MSTMTHIVDNQLSDTDVYKPWALYNAITSKDLNRVEMLLKNKNRDLNFQYQYLSYGIRNFTPLILAVINKSPEIVSRLLKESPDRLDRNIADLNGNSAILFAVLMGHSPDDTIQEILKLLLDDPYVNKEYIKPSNNTGLMKCALWVENMKTIETLLDYGVSVNMEDLDQYRIDFYNQIVDSYYSPYFPKGKGYLKLLGKYPKKVKHVTFASSRKMRPIWKPDRKLMITA